MRSRESSGFSSRNSLIVAVAAVVVAFVFKAVDVFLTLGQQGTAQPHDYPIAVSQFLRTCSWDLFLLGGFLGTLLVVSFSRDAHEAEPQNRDE
jgi:hypothetical protein